LIKRRIKEIRYKKITDRISKFGVQGPDLNLPEIAIKNITKIARA